MEVIRTIWNVNDFLNIQFINCHKNLNLKGAIPLNLADKSDVVLRFHVENDLILLNIISYCVWEQNCSNCVEYLSLCLFIDLTEPPTCPDYPPATIVTTLIVLSLSLLSSCPSFLSRTFTSLCGADQVAEYVCSFYRAHQSQLLSSLSSRCCCQTITQLEITQLATSLEYYTLSRTSKLDPRLELRKRPAQLKTFVPSLNINWQ